MRARAGASWAAGSLLVASGLRRLAHRSGVSDEEAYASLPGDEVIAHPMLERGKPVDPSDEAALQAREDELRAGGLYLEFSWAFVLRPVDAQRTRLLLRARNNVGPQRLAGLLDVPIGLVDVYEGGGMLRGIRARATQPA